MSRFLDVEAAEEADSEGQEEAPASRGRPGRKRRAVRSPSASEVEGAPEEDGGAGGEGQDAVALDGALAGAHADGVGVRRRKFRCSARHFALTYPQCPVARADWRREFGLRFSGCAYWIARETHKDGSYHLHMLVSYKLRKDVQSASYFDVAVDGRSYHPNIKRCWDVDGWFEYISKGDDHDDVPDAAERLLCTEPAWRVEKAYHGELWRQRELAARSRPGVVYPVRLVCEGVTYELRKPDPAIKKRSWWIVARPNAGKTRWLNSTFAGHAIWKPRVGKYPFEGYAGEEIIVYDDREPSFEEVSDVLNTWLIQSPVYGEVRFRTQDWPIGATRSIIVLSNKTIEDTYKMLDVERMKKRFIQISHPVLIKEEEQSDDEVLETESQVQAREAMADGFAS